MHGVRQFGSNTNLIHKISTCKGLDNSMILICEQQLVHRNSHSWGIMGKTDWTYIPYSHLNCPPPLWYVAIWGRTFWEPDSGFLANYDKDRLHALPASVLLCFAKSLKPTTLGSEPRAVSVFPGQLAEDNASQSYSIPWGKNTINKFVVRAYLWGLQFEIQF